jgi:hypothetical protein
MNPTSMRILFVSCHGYVDPSSGAAISTRQLLELLAARGHDCRVLSTGVLDYQEETSLETILTGLKVPFRRSRAMLSQGSTSVFDLELGGVRVSLLPTSSSNYPRSPDPVESAIFLEMADQVFARFRPQVILTYGGLPVSLEMMARARRGGIPVVFFLRNLRIRTVTAAIWNGIQELAWIPKAAKPANKIAHTIK